MKLLIIDALIDSAKMIPFLLVIYCFVEWIERRLGDTINTNLQKAAKAGPALGALFGCLPQCGFSVLASAMYTRRLITIGTLLAVYLATSDEAIPVILAQPDKARIVIPLIFTKLIIGIVCGYVIDLLLRSYRQMPHTQGQSEVEELHEKGCCEHNISGGINKWQFITHPLIHTAKVFLFVFVVTLGINYLIWHVGPENLGKALLQHSIFQPILAALVGLIPNCAASVAITEVFLKGGISFGSAISGLCASGGLGILVLMKENGDTRDTLRVLGLLFGISVVVGIIIQSILPTLFVMK